MEKTYDLITLGCRVNTADSLKIERELSRRGFRKCAISEAPSFWIINTCAVTAEGMRKSRKTVRKCARTGIPVYVTGCASEMEPATFESMGDNVHVVRTRDETTIFDFITAKENPGEPVPWSCSNLVRVPLKVQDGCSRYCNYCIVPYLRGKPVSRPMREIISDTADLVSAGAREIIICGIDLGSYNDPVEGGRLEKLIKKIHEAFPSIWIRLSSIEINDITGGILQSIAGGIACEHLHLPLQSGDDRVLENMGRQYDTDFYREKVANIRERIPSIAISTDVMVGFPTEDEPAFSNTATFLKEIGFSRVHVFKYSSRKGTKAFALGDPVESKVKERRALVLREAARLLSYEFHRRFLRNRVDVLIEGPVGERPGVLFGRTRNFAGVFVRGEARLTGAFATVEVTGASAQGMEGNIIEVKDFSEKGELSWKNVYSAES